MWHYCNFEAQELETDILDFKEVETTQQNADDGELIENERKIQLLARACCWISIKYLLIPKALFHTRFFHSQTLEFDINHATNYGIC